MSASLKQTKKRRRFISTDDSSLSSDGSDSIPLSINGGNNLNRATSYLKRDRSVSTDSSTSTSFPFVGSKTRSFTPRTNKAEEENKMYDDSSSIDTAELLRSILQPKDPSISDKNIAPEAGHEGDTMLPNYNKKRVCDRVSNDLLVDEQSVDIDTASTLRESSAETKVKSLNDDADSVETAELMRRIRQPVDCDPTLTAAPNQTNMSASAQTLCNNIYFATNQDNTTIKDLAESVTVFPGNILEISIHETIGLEDDCNEKVDEKFPLSEQCEDEFVLPDQSDSSVSSDPDDEATDVAWRATLQDQRCTSERADSKRKNHHKEEDAFLAFTEPHRDLPNAGSSSHATKIHGSTIVEAIQASILGRPSLEVGRLSQSIENEKYRFTSHDKGIQNPSNKYTLGSPNSSDQHHSDEHQFDCNNDARANDENNIRIRRMQKSRYIEDLVRYPKMKNSTENEENIENFSDDECTQGLGFGEEAAVLLGRRQCANRLDCVASHKSDTKSLKQRCIATSNGQLSLGRCPGISAKPAKKPNFSNSCSNGFIDSKHHANHTTGTLNDQRNGQVPNLRLPSTDLTQGTTNVHHTNRPRRIRDPSARPICEPHQQSNISSAKRFRVYTDHTSTFPAQTLTMGTAPTTIWERNDIFGGSGVGAGSYQMHAQPYPDSQPVAGDAPVIEVDSSSQCDTVVPTKRRPVSKPPRSFRKANVDGGSKAEGKKAKRCGSRSGGGRGKWGWKNKGNRMSKGKSSASNQNVQRRNGSTWAGNTDDPQLRHVGGAEMSF
jgi:hypothetical protein